MKNQFIQSNQLNMEKILENFILSFNGILGIRQKKIYEIQMIENAVSSSCNETAFLYYVVISKYHDAFGLYNTYRFPSP